MSTIETGTVIRKRKLITQLLASERNQSKFNIHSYLHVQCWMSTFTLTTFRSMDRFLRFCACSMHDIGGSRQMAQQLFMSYQYFQEEKSVVNLQTIDTPRQYGAQVIGKAAEKDKIIKWGPTSSVFELSVNVKVQNGILTPSPFYLPQRYVLKLILQSCERYKTPKGYCYYTKDNVSKWFLPQKSSANFYLLFSLLMQVQLGKDFDLAQGQKLDHRNQSWLLIHEES